MWSLLNRAQAAVVLLPAQVEDVDPSGRGLPGIQAVYTIVSWTMLGSLIMCGLGAIVSAGFIGVSKLVERPRLGERGQLGLLGSFVGAVLIGVAIPLVNQMFSLTG